MIRIFVFGSNLAGRHGAGAARDALFNHGAVYGQGEGLQGRSYAIPTKDADLRPLPLDAIREAVDRFLEVARSLPDHVFDVTRVGCGLAGYSEDAIGPMFAAAPANVRFCDPTWERFRATRVVRQWRVTGDPGEGYPPYEFIWPRPNAAEHGEGPLDGEAAARAFYEATTAGWRSRRLEHRTVAITDWEEVDG